MLISVHSCHLQTTNTKARAILEDMLQQVSKKIDGYRMDQIVDTAASICTRVKTTCVSMSNLASHADALRWDAARCSIATEVFAGFAKHNKHLHIHKRTPQLVCNPRVTDV